MSVRFKTPNATPPIGCYEYECGGEYVSSRSKREICNKVSALRKALGLPVHGDPFRYVMEYMCPRMPNGFCTEPSAVQTIKGDDVKRVTARLFDQPCVTSDEIERRLTVCMSCGGHVTRGFCMGCSGLIDWIYKGFGGRRGKLPPDSASGVCSYSLELEAASASVDRPQVPGDAFPDNCWRKLKEAGNGN